MGSVWIGDGCVLGGWVDVRYVMHVWWRCMCGVWISGEWMGSVW